MSDQSSAQERTEEPSAKRLLDARAKGQIPRSKELNTVVMLLVSVVGLVALGDSISNEFRSLISYDLQLNHMQAFNKAKILEGLQINTIAALKILTPFLLLMFIAVFVGPLFMGGLSFSGKAMAPKFNKLNPASGFKRMFGIQGLVELIKAILKIVLLGTVTVFLVFSLKDRYITLGQEPLLSGVQSGMHLLALVFVILSVSLIVVAIIDVPYQKWNHKRKLKMTRQEVKEENKETNGNPELKSRIRSMQMEVASRRMMQEVPDADVVIVNPTHFSVALKYDDGKVGAAPKVVAKGVDHMALKIREIALEHDILLFEAPPLARALYHHTELEQEIPEELFLAVAQVLSYVYQLKGQVAVMQNPASKPTDLPIPEEFLRNE